MSLSGVVFWLIMCLGIVAWFLARERDHEHPRYRLVTGFCATLVAGLLLRST